MAVAIVFIAPGNVLSQTPALPITPRVDTTHADTREIYHVWNAYLASVSDPQAGMALWSDAETKRYRQYDISRAWLYGSGMYDYYKINPRLLSIEPVGELYAIRTLYLPEDLPRSPGVYSLQRIYAKQEGYAWRLMNALSVLSDDWRRERIGYLEFIFPPDHELDYDAARRASSFADSVVATFDLKLNGPIEYYLGRNVTEMAAICGLEFTWDTNDGRAYPENQQVFVATGTEDYLHEIAHVLFGPLDVAWMIGEGLATYLGGFGEKSFHKAASESARVLLADPGIQFDDILNQRYFDFQLYYVTGALIVEAVLAEGDTEALWQFLDIARTPETVYAGLNDVLGVPRDDVDSFLRGRALQHADQ